MADIKFGFASSTPVTCTLATLTDSSARSSAALDNGSVKYLDAMIYLAIKVPAGSPSSDRAIYVWFYASEDGSNYTAGEDGVDGTDKALTLSNPHNLRGPFPIAVPIADRTYKAVIASVASFFGGILPRKWGFVVQNKTGITLDGTEGNHTKTYTGVYTTSV